MSNLRNNVNLIGNLGMDPEVKQFETGKTKATLSVATTDVYKNAKGEKTTETQWHRVVAWGKTAENMGKLLAKGAEIAVSGKLTHRSYEDKNGVQRYISEVVVNEFQLMRKPA